MTRCEQQDSLLKEQRETLCSLEADCDEVSPIEPNEVEQMSAVNGCTRSLGVKEIPGPLEVAQIPEVIAPECVVECVSGASVPEGEYSASVMACVHEIGMRTDPDGGRVYCGNRAGSAERGVQGPFLVFGAAWASSTLEAGA